MKRTWKQILAMGVSAVALVGFLFIVSPPEGGFFTNWILDWFWHVPHGMILNDKEHSENVSIVAIDNESLRILRKGEKRISRKVYADLIDAVASMGAVAIAFDVLFPEAGNPEEDRQLEDAVKRSGKVVANCTLLWEGAGEATAAIKIENRSIFREYAAGEGYANFPVDRDGNVRRIRFFVRKGDIPVRIPLSIAAYLVGAKRKAEDLEMNGNQVMLPVEKFDFKDPVSLDYQGLALVGYLGSPRTIKTVSALDVLQGKADPNDFAGKYIFIGGTADEFRDNFLTPFSPKGDMPGVEIHAHVLTSILNQRVPMELNGPWFRFLLLVLAAVTAMVSGWFHPERTILLILIASGAWWYVDLRLFFVYGVFINVVEIWMAVGVGWLTSVAIEAYLRQREKSTLAKLFRQYVSPNLLSELMEHPEAIALGGARKEAIVFFADVRGFTTICEESPPEKVISFLNRYFNVATQAIFDQGGILDKYIGDGMMAFFGIPIQHGNEADNAVIAALKVRDALSRLVATAKSTDDFPIKAIGIGIHGGDVVVGNVGSEMHQEYTLLGDTVNVSARLESLARQGEILISAFVQKKLTTGKFDVVSRGTVKVRGRKTDLDIFEVKGLASSTSLLQRS